MNQLCKVCGEPAAGFHFGAFTCEGCKSFFGRTYNNLSSLNDCKNSGKCIINKKNRTSCKACRLRKCLMVGMSKSGSRYGRRSNWFKIHCLLQEQTGLDPSLQGLGESVGGVDSDDTTKPLGLDTRDDLIPKESGSPVLSSPESQISENSVEVSDSLRASRLSNNINFIPSPFLSSHRHYFSPMTTMSPPSPSLSPHMLPQPMYQGYGEAIARRQYLDHFLRQQHKPMVLGGEAPEQDRPIDLSLNKSSNITPPPVSPVMNDYMFEDSAKTIMEDLHHPLDLSIRAE